MQYIPGCGVAGLVVARWGVCAIVTNMGKTVSRAQTHAEATPGAMHCSLSGPIRTSLSWSLSSPNAPGSRDSVAIDHNLHSFSLRYNIPIQGVSRPSVDMSRRCRLDFELQYKHQKTKIPGVLLSLVWREECGFEDVDPGEVPSSDEQMTRKGLWRCPSRAILTAWVSTNTLMMKHFQGV